MTIKVNSWFNWIPAGLALAVLWFVLINHLRIEWAINPQYSYGWAVPFLCAYLIWQRGHKTRGNLGRSAGSPGLFPSTRGTHLPVSFFHLGFWGCALLYAPTRLIQEANPEWRLVSWALALEVVGITLCGMRLMQNAFPLRRENGAALDSNSTLQFRNLSFPICFFLVAVPWPTVIEGPLIQALTRAVSGITVELLGLLGIPVIQHGNVLELSTGLLGIDEACSGIRSFQATLMISLFLGEIYALSVGRRVVFVVSGFALAFSFNVVRTLVLTMVAARKGISAVASWHDPAGVTILVGCFLSLWLVGLWLSKAKAESRKQKAETETAPLTADPRLLTSGLRFQRSTLALCLWLAGVELGVEWWYRSHEAKLPAAVVWNVAWPTNHPSFKERAVSKNTRQILRYDEGRNATWAEDGLNWQAIFLRWNPGRAALYLARNHTPEICLPAAGRTLVSTSELQWFNIHGLRLPFRAYELAEGGVPLRVYYCLWNDRSDEQGFKSEGLGYANRLGPVLAAERNAGQRSLEIAVRGIGNAGDAEAVVRRELEKLIVVPGFQTNRAGSEINVK